ncbi:MAG: transposase [Gammaproteobacteria bacterium]
MPRAHRSYLPGCVWHITHRCHNRAFLLNAAVDRANWRRWLWEATSRYGLSVLDFVATSNHIHLLVHDAPGDKTIARSLQLVEGQTAQAYNRRRGRKGAFWQDRYHAVAIDSERHLWNCLVYIDLNMVRARAVRHPDQWRFAGYNEIQQPRSRYRVLDLDRLAALTGCASVGQLQREHRERVAAALSTDTTVRDPRWTESIAVGTDEFVDRVRVRLGLSSLKRVTEEGERGCVLRESEGRYAAKGGRYFLT